MRTVNYKNIFFLIVFFTALTSCKNMKLPQESSLKTMPADYGHAKDSANSVHINWEQYFKDSLLTGIIDEGLQNNPDVLMALQRVEIGAAGFHIARGALFPSVSANAAFAQRKFGLYTMDGAGNIATDITPGRIVPIHLPDYYTALQTSWEVDIWGKLRNKRRAAFARYLSGVEGKNLVVTNLVAQLAGAYYELVSLDNKLNVIRETIDIQQKALELVTAQKQAAAANELAVSQFKAQLLNSKAIEYEVVQAITEYENKINFLLGRYPQAIPRSKSSFTARLNFMPEVGIPSDLLKNRPDIRQAELELLATKADVRAARAAFYPSFTISGSAGFQAFQPGLLFQTPESIAYSIIGSLAAPLINRSAIKAAFKTAGASQLEAFYKYQKSILNGYVEVNNEVARIKNLENIATLKTEEVEVLNQSIETASELFRTSRAGYLEVLMTQKRALEARLEFLDVKRRQYTAAIDIYKALGGGWR